MGKQQSFLAIFICATYTLLFSLQVLATETSLNVKNYGASGSAQSTTGTLVAGSNTLQVASAIDFAVDQGIFIDQAKGNGVPLITSITAINGNTITLAEAAWASVSNVYVTHDDNRALKRAFVASKNHPTAKTVLLPKGTYQIHPTEATTDMMSRIIMIYDGTTLLGEGFDSVMKVIPKSMYKNVMWRAVAYQGNTTMKNFRMDGSKDLVDRSILTGAPSSLILLRSSIDNLSNITFDTLWLHNVYGNQTEAFAVLTPNGGRNILFQNIQGWNIEGTAVHVGGMYPDNFTESATVKNSIFFNCTYMGISVYGARNISLENIKVYNNKEHGVNIEWSHDIRLSQIEAYSNGQGGVGTWGKADFSLVDSKLYNNNYTNTRAEIDLNPGSWLDGSLRGNVGKVSVERTTVTPRSNTAPHLYIRTDHTINIGDRLPENVTLATEDAANWRIKTVVSGITVEQGRFLPNMMYTGLTLVSVPVPKLVDWYRTSQVGSSGVIPYEGVDRTSTDAVQVTSSQKSGNIYTNLLLQPGKKYRVKIRYQVQTDQSWWLMLKTEDWMDNPQYFIELGRTGKPAGAWVEAQAIFPTPALEKGRLQLLSNANVVDSLVMDYVTVEEVQ